MLTLEEKAHLYRDLRRLLAAHGLLWYRAQIQFWNGYKDTAKRTFYGDEHSCTYNQCLHGYVKEILLDRQKGYEELLYLIEKKYRGQYRTATVFGKRNINDKGFDLRLRSYSMNGIENTALRKDPEFSENLFRTVNFSIEEAGGQPSKVIIGKDVSLSLDFKKLISERLGSETNNSGDEVDLSEIK